MLNYMYTTSIVILMLYVELHVYYFYSDPYAVLQ